MQLERSHVVDSGAQLASWQTNMVACNAWRIRSAADMKLHAIGLRKPERCVIAIGVSTRGCRSCFHTAAFVLS